MNRDEDVIMIHEVVMREKNGMLVWFRYVERMGMRKLNSRVYK